MQERWAGVPQPHRKGLQSMLTSVCLPVPLHGLFSVALPAHTCPLLILPPRAANIQTAHSPPSLPSAQQGPHPSFLPQPLFVKVFSPLTSEAFSFFLPNSKFVQYFCRPLGNTGVCWAGCFSATGLFVFVLFLFVVLAIPRK